LAIIAAARLKIGKTALYAALRENAPADINSLKDKQENGA
jgi:hypothetical protein